MIGLFFIFFFKFVTSLSVVSCVKDALTGNFKICVFGGEIGVGGVFDCGCNVCLCLMFINVVYGFYGVLFLFVGFGDVIVGLKFVFVFGLFLMGMGVRFNVMCGVGVDIFVLLFFFVFIVFNGGEGVCFTTFGSVVAFVVFVGVFTMFCNVLFMMCLFNSL